MYLYILHLISYKHTILRMTLHCHMKKVVSVGLAEIVIFFRLKDAH